MFPLSNARIFVMIQWKNLYESAKECEGLLLLSLLQENIKSE